MDSPCSSFEGEIVGYSPHDLCGKEAKILLEDHTISVLIEAVQAELGAQVMKVRISGRDLTGVLVDSSADAREFSGSQDLSEIAKKLCEPFGIQIRSEAGNLPLRDFKISPGERIYEALERGARMHGVFFLPSNGTQLTIVSPAKKAPAPLADFPIVSATYKKDISERFGEYIVQSQNFALFAEPNVEKRSLDPEISPRKKLIIVSPEDNPQARADMERDIRKNRGEEIEITLPGIRIFPLGCAIELQHPLLTGTYLVKSQRLQVDTTQGSSKRESLLSLKPVAL
jgi:prophage tail gpP-like protein